MKKLASALVVFLTVLVVLGCNRDGGEDVGVEARHVSGLITNVEARSLFQLDTLKVNDQQGTVWTFQAGRSGLGDGAHIFSPSHLRQHMVQGVPIIVTYIEMDKVKIIANITE